MEEVSGSIPGCSTTNKMKLKSLFESVDSVKNFNATQLDADDIIQILRMTGYNDRGNEDAISAAEAEGHLAYAGYTTGKSHKYVYAWFDDEDSEKWQVIALYIDLGTQGTIQCDFGSMPIHQFDEEDEIDKYFKRVKRDKKA